MLDTLTRPLDALLDAAGIEHEVDARPVAGVTADTREMRRGHLFVAVTGVEEDGHRFVEEAIEAGAAAVISERPLPEMAVPVVRVPDAREALAHLAAAWYERPAERLQICGITGSLGKTSVLTFLEALMEEAGVRVGAIGSEIVGIRVHDRFDLTTPNTTPDPITLHRGLRVMADSGVTAAAMEVSSHAIDQRRTTGLRFAAGVFTNLVPLEHQDYHGSFEGYVGVKMGFVELMAPGAPLIIGADSERLVEELGRRGLDAIRCGFSDDADVRITDVVLSADGTRYTLDIRRPIPRADGSLQEPTRIPLKTRLLGRPHILNAAFATTTALTLTDDVEALQRGLANIEPPGRRMELSHLGDVLLLDDTAGHPESLDAVFDVASRLESRSVHVVAAIRGGRGAEINARLAATIAQHYHRHALDALITTDSADTVQELDTVSDEERRAFLQTLGANDAPTAHHDRLEDALAALSGHLEPGDLVVLVGAQGMRQGAEMIRRMIEEA